MRLLVVLLPWDKTVEVQIDDDKTVGYLKQVINRDFAIPIAIQNITINSRHVIDSELLVSVFRDNSRVFLDWNKLRLFKPRARPSDPGKNLYIFDMDDTITINGTVPDSVYASLWNLYSQGNTLAVASFNLSAIEILRSNNVLESFSVIACGFTDTVSKAKHVGQCLKSLGLHRGKIKSNANILLTNPKIFYFDDIEENLDDVRSEFPYVACIKVAEVRLLPHIIDTVNIMTENT